MTGENDYPLVHVGVPKVSFVMTTFRFRAFIEEAVTSILEQTLGAAVELIVVDDASNDGTVECLRGFADPRLRIIANARNMGVAKAINTGMALARGKYIARVDGDDVWHPEFAATLTGELDRNPSVGMIYADVRLIDQHGGVVSERSNLRRPRNLACEDEWRALLERNYICSPAVVARREAWQHVLPWEVDVGPGDWRGHLRIASRWRLAYFDRPLADYRLHGGGMHCTYQHTLAAERVVEETLNEMFDSPACLLSPLEKRLVRAGHARDLAYGYLAANRADEADRLLLRALGLNPALLLDPAMARQAGAMILGRSRYERIKAMLGRRGAG